MERTIAPMGSLQPQSLRAPWRLPGCNSALSDPELCLNTLACILDSMVMKLALAEWQMVGVQTMLFD